MWDLSCLDWQERLELGLPLVPDLPLLDTVAADNAVALFNRLRLADVPGNPTLEVAAGEWYRDIVRALFGSWDAKTQTRHIREIFALVGKKNSKTTYSASLMLVALLRNARPGAKFILVAPTHDVTELAYAQAAGAVRLDEEISDIIKTVDHQKYLEHRVTGATLEILSFDPNVLTGQKPTGFMLDELHIVASSPSAATAVGQLRGGMISQPEAFGLFVTTQSEKPPRGVFEAELKNARAIRDGKEKGKTLPILYEFPEAIAKDREQWSNTKNWYMVMPNRGRPVTEERLLEDFDKAKNTGSAEFTRWASQHLNIEVGLGLAQDNWPGAEFWEAATDVKVTLEYILENCEVLVAGIDGGGLDDLLGLSIVGREKITKRWLGWTRGWAHEKALERKKANITLYEGFSKDGDLKVVSAYPEDLDGVLSVLKQAKDTKKLARVGLDKIGLRQAVDALASIGISEEIGNLIGIAQGIALGPAGKALERKLVDGTFAHSGQRLLNWAVSNVMIRATSTAFLFDKEKSGYGKIDNFMALLNAVELMATNPEPPDEESVYTAERGIVFW